MAAGRANALAQLERKMAAGNSRHAQALRQETGVFLADEERAKGVSNGGLP